MQPGGLNEITQLKHFAESATSWPAQSLPAAVSEPQPQVVIFLLCPELLPAPDGNTALASPQMLA